MALNLRAPQLDDLGLAAAIRWNLSRQSELAGLRSCFSAADVPPQSPEPLGIACYRISQEALTNVLRHAQACKVWVRLWRQNGELCFELRDDGVGFDPAPVLAGSNSMGVLGMQERAQLAGGRLEIESAPGLGCQVRAVFPLIAGAPP